MTFYKIIISICLSILCVAGSYAQSSYDEIQLLINQGQFKKALNLTEDELASNKSDIKLQFMKGLILTRLDQFSEAEQVFIRLTTDNPDLPEPFNNLAVVYAAQGKYVEAEAALKNAINTHPSYATAHENLGDIYAKMASRAYNQALELDTSNRTAREKLSLVNELISAPPETTANKKEVVAVTAVPEPETITIPVKTEPVTAKTQAKVTVQNPDKADVEEAIAQNRIDVDSSLKNWVNAWSAQDVDTYLATYAQEFIPPQRLSRSEWEKDRRIRLRKPGFIKITLSNVKINLHGKDYAEIKFTQAYQSNTYSDKVKKELLMRKIADKWLITQERTR